MMSNASRRFPLLVTLVCVTLPLMFAATDLAGQQSSQDPNVIYDPALFSALEYRMIGPYRGGRSTAVTGVPDRPHTYYQGTTGGGVWKTIDDGQTWENISDGYFGGSIGAVAVATSDQNVIYVGTGSACIRGNTSTGHGVYKSTDGGKTWVFIGLPEAGQVGQIVVHPNNADLVYVAALGHPFGKNPERGVYRSSDGGATWELVLFASDSTGAVALSMNPQNPREIYAGMWRAERKPWSLLSGSTDGGVFKTTDGGDNWKKLAGGLPTGLAGRIGVTVSPANPDRVWVLIEAEPDGGVYRSDDAGETWTRTNSENKLRQRAWYYTHIIADPKDEHTVYALNTGFYRSVDGGRTFQGFSVPHGDVHDLWINPNDPNLMVVADDGGAQVSVNGAKSWSTMYNQPTAELYDVVADNAFPYRVYGAQQDNTTISLLGWFSTNTLHPKQHWYSVGGCETGPIALHPDYPNTVYAGCYGGVIDRFDRDDDQIRNVVIYPQMQLGEAGKNLRYRFQWVAPMAVSPHDPDVVYHGSQHVHRSMDRGISWETISPDLTTDTPEHQEYSGGPINHDITGVEIYNTVFSITVSPHSPDVVWAGTDDGRLHVTRDNGATWQDVTPNNMPQYGTVDLIDVSPHQAGVAYVAVQKFRFDDFAPYIFKTDNYGESWARLTDGTNGIPGNHAVRAVREDRVRQGMLYAGTEFGMYVSFNDGRNWQSLQLNLPITPVTGMEQRHDDIIISTQGRSFWVLDDVTPLRQITDAVAGTSVHLYEPRDAYRVNSGGGSRGGIAPERLPGKALIHYYLGDVPAEPITLEILDASGGVVRTFSSDSATAAENNESPISADAGMSRATWDVMYPGIDPVEGTVLWGYSGGVKAPPATYQVRLTANGETLTQSFEVLKDPRLDHVTQRDFDEQFRLSIAVRDTLNQMYAAIRQTQSVSDQVVSAMERVEEAGLTDEFGGIADTITAGLTDVEEAMTQTKNQSGQDPIRFAPMLDSQFLSLYEYVTGVDGYRYGGAEGRPTQGAIDLFADLNLRWVVLRDRLSVILNSDVNEFNELLRNNGVPGVTVPGRGRDLIP
jgi:photosystem II stability/assembly factor-like uncharacterized protein